MKSKEKKSTQTKSKKKYSLGRSIERVGQKLRKNGYEKIGAGVEKIGGQIDHIQDQKLN